MKKNVFVLFCKILNIQINFLVWCIFFNKIISKSIHSYLFSNFADYITVVFMTNKYKKCYLYILKKISNSICYNKNIPPSLSHIK